MDEYREFLKMLKSYQQSIQYLQFLQWAEPRALTNRERACLQTFEAILKSFAGVPYDSMPANIDE